MNLGPVIDALEQIEDWANPLIQDLEDQKNYGAVFTALVEVTDACWRIRNNIKYNQYDQIKPNIYLLGSVLAVAVITLMINGQEPEGLTD